MPQDQQLRSHDLQSIPIQNASLCETNWRNNLLRFVNSREYDQSPQCCSAFLSKVCKAYSPAIGLSERISHSSLVNMVIITVLMRAEDYCQPLPVVRITPCVREHHCPYDMTLEPSLHFRLGLKLISPFEKSLANAEHWTVDASTYIVPPNAYNPPIAATDTIAAKSFIALK